MCGNGIVIGPMDKWSTERIQMVICQDRNGCGGAEVGLVMQVFSPYFALGKYRINESVRWRVNFSTDSLAEIEDLPDVSLKIVYSRSSNSPIVPHPEGGPCIEISAR